jgi:hypothetical protein
MNMPKIDPRTVEAMREARRHNKTYREIEAEFGVSRSATINYLKGTTIKKQRFSSLEVENTASAFLEENGFDLLIDLNKVSDEPASDLLLMKGEDKWLVNLIPRVLGVHGDDLQIGTIRTLPGYRTAVLIIDEKNVYAPIFLEICEIREQSKSKKKS